MYMTAKFVNDRGMKNAIFSLLANENMPRVLMTVIRYAMSCWSFDVAF